MQFSKLYIIMYNLINSTASVLHLRKSYCPYTTSTYSSEIVFNVVVELDESAQTDARDDEIYL